MAEKFIKGKRARASTNDVEDVLFTDQSGAGVQSCRRKGPRRGADHGDFKVGVDRMRELEAVAHNWAVFQGTNLEREVVF